MQVQTVGFEKLANAFDSEALINSILRRIQRFIAQYALNSDLIAKLIFGLLPQKENLKISIDGLTGNLDKPIVILSCLVYLINV